MKCIECGKEFEEEKHKTGWNIVKCPRCGKEQMPESMKRADKIYCLFCGSETERVKASVGDTFMQVRVDEEWRKYDLYECPNCGLTIMRRRKEVEGGDKTR